MRGTLFFVHGAGVRGPGLGQTLGALQQGLDRNGMGSLELAHSAWGDRAGVSLGDVSATLPEPPSTRGVSGDAEPGPTDRTAALWAVLLDDPRFELRVVGTAGPASGGGPGAGGVTVGELRPEQQARDMLARLSAAGPDLGASGLSDGEFRVAAREIADSPELAAAARAVSPTDPELIEAIARAVVAAALAGHRLDLPGEAPPAATDPAVRDALVAATMEVLAPAATRGLVGDLLRKTVGGFVAREATKLAASRRASIMGLQAWTIADVMSYQRRSDGILDAIRRDLTAVATGPIVAVGHSLGGIALVDLLSRPDRPPVDLLVTIGSQSPMLFAFDALGTLRPGQRDRPFTPWLNIFSPQDFVSFVAGRIFGGVPDITDIGIELALPFPESHSGYWRDDRVFHAIRDAWPAAGR